MKIHALTEADRAVALEKAREARSKRAAVREKLKRGEITLAQAIDMGDDPVIGRMKVSALIKALPGYGKAASEKIMEELDIYEGRRLSGLGKRQREALLKRLG